MLFDSETIPMVYITNGIISQECRSFADVGDRIKLLFGLFEIRLIGSQHM